ncbi:MAG TPA: nucleoside 2-deoxyribosyltransferase [Anaerolineales bacterium]|nr:nucleoside 2-deoxyribosyltransferase [Anaerolineales bacterium]
MIIYFACSITGGRELEAVYRSLVEALTGDGHEVPTAHLAEAGVMALEAVIDPQDVYARDVTWIRTSDVLIAEASVPSHGVGYEIGFALGLGKPVLALHQEGRKVSKMISGNPNPKLFVRAYRTPENAVEHIREFLSRVNGAL